MKFSVIGIADSPQPFFPPEVMRVISQGEVFSGGKRHHEIVAPMLPETARWIDITVPIDHVFEQNEALAKDVVVFASGDPLFFGFANTIRRKLPDAEIVLYPTFNSLQSLAHRLVMPYHDMRIVSLTGRPWPAFDRVLIERAQKIGVLTDREHTPAAIASRMLDYGYKGYVMHVGEHLGHPTEERVHTLTLEEAVERSFGHPNCVILVATSPLAPAPFFCTGSVSIEARLQFPHLHVVAFEIREECEALIHTNSCRFGAPGIEAHIGDFLTTDIEGLPRPDAVFIGGHGGHLKAIMAKVLTVLTDNGLIVTNSVTSRVVEQMTSRLSSKQLFHEACAELGLTEEPPTHIALNDYNPIEILKCRR